MRLYLTLSLLLFLAPTHAPAEVSMEDALSQIQEVGSGGYRHEQAMAGLRVLEGATITAVPPILAAIKTDQPLAANWLRSAAEQVLERHLRDGKSLPADTLEKIVFDRSYAPRARRLAYEWLRTADSSAEERIIPQMLNDSSLEMRRDAVQRLLTEAKERQGAAAVQRYREALNAARDFDQVETAQKALAAFNEEVDLQKHFGFLVDWQLIGPFDNSDKAGFDVEYGPESDLRSKTVYSGKQGEVKWARHQTTDPYGAVNLNEAIGKHMGAVAYAYAELQVSEAREVDLRLVSKNANKVWLNGEQLMANEVYHAGSKFDQYVAKGRLRAGKNQLLLKICQNEQTESWAQDWEFQIRICDELGTAVPVN